MNYRFAVALLVLALLPAAVARAADEKPQEGNKLERAAGKAGRAVDKAATKAGNWADRSARKAAKALGRAAEKTDNWIKKKTR